VNSNAASVLRLSSVVNDIADSIVAVDQSLVPFKHFQPGVGPYGEPQLVRAIAERLNQNTAYAGRARTKRCPDLLIEDAWALEVKLARPFGDNGKEAENWSVNLLHPYEGNVSVIGDCMKLRAMGSRERKAVVVIGYEHTPPRIHLEPLMAAFEAIAKHVCAIRLSDRIQARRTGLIHPVHQQVLVAAWEVEPPVAME
jgi:hypothetical protein